MKNEFIRIRVYNVTHPSNNFSLISLIFAKIVETKIDWALSASVRLPLLSSFFNGLTNSIC